jgi:hypothetical protein
LPSRHPSTLHTVGDDYKGKKTPGSETPVCHEKLDVATKYLGDFFSKCLSSNVDPMRICQNCGESYRQAISAFHDLQEVCIGV